MNAVFSPIATNKALSPCGAGSLLRVCSGQSLTQQQIHHHFADTLQQQGFPLPICQKVFTLASEMINNAIDHGLLELPSSLKDQEDGFSRFYHLRQQRLQQLEQHRQITTSLCWTAPHMPGFLQLQVSHNGRGWHAYNNTAATNNNLQASGRGLLLIKALSSHFESLEGGRLTRIRLDY
ncbi:ATP-binding protein [Marinospirillum alkaliphilum]|uniref:Histidine kinase-like ATPase domain-containing protein n=1 Tax=Marinospirillum alkaliphilum DSM 21637 TaxID=1122209 RepID=A0A1K1Y0U5_9GAMM|nr:ATP-binding protein [Marinospirillum alkaliphilum]SFX55641.1 Histidine kinase-like ATPase domain-containing protein [Marinospirillum alkaliphilum DSM 21637]